MTLYEWVQCSTKKKRTQRERGFFEEEIRQTSNLKSDYYKAALARLNEDIEPTSDQEDILEDEPDDENIFDDAILQAENSSPEFKDESDWKTDAEDDVILDKETRKTKENRPVNYPFMPQHSLFRSHSISCNFDHLYTMIPNFIGGSIPRSDKGDRAAYCMTMLTLFKPWRSPGDLKDSLSTWDQAFKEHDFTERQS
jgi:hypothetical protein